MKFDRLFLWDLFTSMMAIVLGMLAFRSIHAGGVLWAFWFLYQIDQKVKASGPSQEERG